MSLARSHTYAFRCFCDGFAFVAYDNHSADKTQKKPGKALEAGKAAALFIFHSRQGRVFFAITLSHLLFSLRSDI